MAGCTSLVGGGEEGNKEGLAVTPSVEGGGVCCAPVPLVVPEGCPSLGCALLPRHLAEGGGAVLKEQLAWWSTWSKNGP